MKQTKAEIILEYCKKTAHPVTAKEILAARFPGKSQPDINSTINQLIAAKKLIRDDGKSPYTVRVPNSGETIPEPRNYSRTHREISGSNSLIQKGTVLLPEDVKNSFNEFWSGFFGNGQDYYSNFTLKELVQLKMVVSKINNLVTYESTLMAAAQIYDILDLSDAEIAKVENRIRTSSVNTNGYDIEYCGSKRFVCEVKANIPSGGKDFFGANQEKEIRKDINGLINGKSKSDISKKDLESYYKFMCFYSDGVCSINAINNFVRNANREYNGILEQWHGQEELTKEKVYVFMVTTEDQHD